MGISRSLTDTEIRSYDVIDPLLAARVRVVNLPAIPGGFDGITVGRWIGLVNPPTTDGRSGLLAHELVHVRQWRDEGRLGFLRAYLGAFARNLRADRSWHRAYLNIPHEKEARAEAKEWSLRHRDRLRSNGLRLRLLSTLYGEEAPSVLARIEDLLARRKSISPPPQAWNHEDIWLITYADQFQNEGTAPLRTLKAFVEKHLSGMCNGVHILPFYPWTSDDGFSVSDYRSVEPTYGTWDDVKALASTRRVMADAVINHMSTASEWFQRFLQGEAPYRDYFHTEAEGTDVGGVVRPRTHPLLTRFETADGPRWLWTTFSTDQVDLNYRSPNLLLEILDILFDYVEGGASVIRLDAIGFLWKDPTRSSIHLPETHAAIQLMRSCLDQVAPGTILISETNVPHEENISYLGTSDQPEVQAVYQFPLAPLTAHAVLTGEVGVLVDWINSIGDLPGPDRSFLNFLASHDGIGVRPAEGLLSDADVAVVVDACRRSGGQVNERSLADGTTVPYELNTTWFDLLAESADSESTAIARHLATHALMLALPGVAAIYVHSLFGSSNDQEGFARTGQNRSLNRRKFTDLSALEAALADPASREARVLSGLTALAAERRRSPAFHPEGTASASSPAPGVVAIERRYGDAESTVVVNLSDRLQSIDVAGISRREIEPYESLWK